ncbi:hypothetical protein ACS0TY_008955 [Phlomoides rotata]
MAAASASTPSEIAAEGPVLNLINKRLRALRKKLNRITQMEESVVQGKILNKEQEETLRSKPSIVAGIDELEKIRQPILQAVDQEIELAVEKNRQKPDISIEKEEEEEAVKPEAKSGNDDDASAISDLLNLLYFSSVFDVKTLLRAPDNMMTRTHERNCCLTYDYVTDDDAAGDPLKEWDLDLISNLGGLLISRPGNSSLSHKESLGKCVEHAKLWLANVDQPIEPDSSITYASLREKLNKIMASEYFTTTPEIKAPVDVAAAAGNYNSFQVPVHGPMIPPVSSTIPVEGSDTGYQQEEEQSPNFHHNEISGDEAGPGEELHQGGGSEVANASETQNSDLGMPDDAEFDQNSRNVDSKDQYRKPYQNYRGGRGRRGGYSNGPGRGGRGGSRGGGYQNGRSQFYDQTGGYYPRNNYRGRGGRGMGPMGGNANANGNYSYSGPTGHAQAAS